MIRILTPHLRLHHVTELTPERLEQLGISTLLLDADSTLKNYRDETVDDTIREWLSRLREADVELCLVSNGRGSRIERLAQSVDLPYIAMALKPLPRGCFAAIRRHGFNPSKTAMVGDQLFADVMAGRTARLFTILVDPLHPEQEPYLTRAKRPLEQFLLRHIPYDAVE